MKENKQIQKTTQHSNKREYKKPELKELGKVNEVTQSSEETKILYVT